MTRVPLYYSYFFINDISNNFNTNIDNLFTLDELKLCIILFADDAFILTNSRQALQSPLTDLQLCTSLLTFTTVYYVILLYCNVEYGSAMCNFMPNKLCLSLSLNKRA